MWVIRRLVFFVVFFTACSNKDFPLHYRDCTEIVGGFYKSCKGRVVSYYYKENCYEVIIDSCKDSYLHRCFDENHLKKIDCKNLSSPRKTL